MTRSLRSMILEWLPKKAPSVTTLDWIHTAIMAHKDHPVVKAFSTEALKALALDLAFDLEKLYFETHKQEAKR